MGATTLTKAQILALFEVLQVPYDTSKQQLSNNGLDAYGVTAIAAAKTKIETRLSEIADDADAETVLKADLTAWIAVRTKTTRIEGGSAGNVAGITKDPREERAELREVIRIQVPFYRAHEMDETGSRTVQLGGY
jgi:hypothetical protein